MGRNMQRILAALFAILLLAGCSASEDISVAEKGITKFHRQLNAGEFDAIYDDASKDMKHATHPKQFVPLLEAVHRKLGKFKKGKVAGWNVNYTTGGNLVSLGYEAEYERGNAAENFVFRMDEKEALLAGYHINSAALIIN